MRAGLVIKGWEGRQVGALLLPFVEVIVTLAPARERSWRGRLLMTIGYWGR